MKKKMKFCSPTKLNNLEDGGFTETQNFVFPEIDNGELTLDIDNWDVVCEDNGIKAKLDTWYVNEDLGMMCNEPKEGYVKIDYPFAVSMVGQLCEPSQLINYLQSLEQLFEVKRKEGTPNSDKESNELKKDENINN